MTFEENLKKFEAETKRIEALAEKKKAEAELVEAKGKVIRNILLGISSVITSIVGLVAILLK